MSLLLSTLPPTCLPSLCLELLETRHTAVSGSVQRRLSQGCQAGAAVDTEHEHVDIWKFTDRLGIVCLLPHLLPFPSPLLPDPSPFPPLSFPNVFPPFSPLSLFSPPSSPLQSSRILFCPLPTVFFPHLLLSRSFFPFPTVFFPSVSPIPRSTASCGGSFSSHLFLPTRSLPVSTFPPIPPAAASRRSLFSPPPPSPHRLLPAYYPQLFSSSPRTVSFPCLPQSSSHPLLLSPSSSFPASYSPSSTRLHIPTFFSQQRLPAALFSPRTKSSLFLFPPSSPHAVFSPHRLLPTPSSPRALPTTVFFPSHRFLPMSSHRLAGASVSRNLLPTFFSPSPHRLFSQPLISAIFFPSPPFSSRFHLPTFSQQRLPAALFSPPLPSPLFHSPPSSPPIVFLPTPFSRSPTAFHLEAPHACARLCPCPRCVYAPRQPHKLGP
nr:uncharacterized protein LOC129051143 [Pongo abelii]